MSSFPVPPPLSTLSAALQSTDDDTVPIAPELMGEDGLATNTAQQHNNNNNNNTIPEKRRSTEYDPSGQSYGGFASSAARDEDGRDWRDDTRGDSAWDDTYREHPFAEPSFTDDASALHPHPIDDNGQDASDSQPKRKRSRVSKPRQSRGDREREELIGDVQAEYEDPNQDIKGGPVFIHPPPGAAQACMRCHRIKRKCDNARPRCAGCTKADVACVFELSPATSTYVLNLKSDNTSLSTQIASAHERIAQLESVVSSLQRGDLPSAVTEFNAEADSRFFPTASSPRADFADLARNILSVRPSAASGINAPTLDALFDHSQITSTSLLGDQNGASNAAYPSYTTAREATDVFFASNAVAYPFLNKEEFLKDVDAAYAKASGIDGQGWGGQSNDDQTVRQRKEFIMFMVMAVGAVTKERLGEAEAGTAKMFKDRALQHLGVAVGHEDVLCLQSLAVLALYSLLDPLIVPAHHIIAFAVRIAVSLGLHHKSDGQALAPDASEQRKAVFWSVYALDRAISTAYGIPLAINDSDIDLESLQLTELEPVAIRYDYFAPLRRLTGVIQQSLYSASNEQNTIPDQTRLAISNSVHGQLDAWYRDTGRAMTVGIKNVALWHELSYNYHLVLIYRPSPLYPVTTVPRLQELYKASVRCLDLYRELRSLSRLDYNLITVVHLLVVSSAVLYALIGYDSRSKALAADATWKQELGVRLQQARELVDTLAGGISESSPLKQVFRSLVAVIEPRAAAPLPGADHKPYVLPADLALDAINPKPEEVDVTKVFGSSFVVSLGTRDYLAAWRPMTKLWYNVLEADVDAKGWEDGKALCRVAIGGSGGEAGVLDVIG